MRVLLVSTYELGHQPFGLASPAAWLREAGVDVECVDVSRHRLEDAAIGGADVVGFYVPMHTAMRLALPLIERVRNVNGAAAVCAFGLYAPLNEAALRAAGVSAVFGGEFEDELTRWIVSGPGVGAREPERLAPLPRLQFRVPDRRGLPALNQYASLQMPDGTRVPAGYTEASRGCKHWCRHCPIVPVYEGHFRIVPPDIVMADVAAQVRAGARHISFGDPDFFNGIAHALAVARAFGRAHPGITYDATIKIEHLLKHADALPVLADTGCLFVTSAVESVEDTVLAKLEKGHTRADFERAVSLCREAGVLLAPTFVPFTPWTTVEGYGDLLETIVRLNLVEHAAPIQLAIRLLVPNGSRLLELDDIRAVIGEYDPRGLVYPWRHPDPRVGRLQAAVQSIVGARLDAPRRETFARVWDAAHAAAGHSLPAPPPTVARAAVPYLTEPWYC